MSIFPNFFKIAFAQLAGTVCPRWYRRSTRPLKGPWTPQGSLRTPSQANTGSHYKYCFFYTSISLAIQFYNYDKSAIKILGIIQKSTEHETVWNQGYQVFLGEDKNHSSGLILSKHDCWFQINPEIYCPPGKFLV